VRSVAFQYETLEELAYSLDEGDFELDVPPNVGVSDGEWVLVLFEIEGDGHLTAAAARAIVRDEGSSLRFAERDWERLRHLACGCSRKSAERARPNSPCLASLAPLPNRVSGIGSRVLVTDGEPLVREMLAAMLEGVGLIVDVATDADEALARLRCRRYDLVVLDGQLPGMTGVELCRALRCELSLDLPVLFLSASTSSREMVEAIAAGADDYLAKPFRAPELGARVFGLLQRAKSVSLTG